MSVQRNTENSMAGQQWQEVSYCTSERHAAQALQSAATTDYGSISTMLAPTTPGTFGSFGRHAAASAVHVVQHRHG
jgi:hypothetical protein